MTRLKLSGKMVAIPMQAAAPNVVYVTFSPYGECRVYYVGTDKEAALDARQCVDDCTVQQTLTVTPTDDEYGHALTLAPLDVR